MIRKLKSCDMEQVMNIWFNGNLEAHDFVEKEYWEMHIPMVKEQLLQAEVYVYEEQGKIQGFAGMQEDYLAGIFVKKEFRGTGIGKQFLDFVKQRHEKLTLHVYEKNQRAIDFYKREGFAAISKEMDMNTNETDYFIVWKK